MDRTRKGVARSTTDIGDSDTTEKKKKKRGPPGPFPADIRSVIDDITNALLQKSKVVRGDKDDADYNEAVKKGWTKLCEMFPDIATTKYFKVSQVRRTIGSVVTETANRATVA